MLAVEPLIANRPPASSTRVLSDRVAGRVGIGRQSGDVPTEVPMPAFSATMSAVAFVGDRADVELIDVVDVDHEIWSVDDPSVLVARTVMLRVDPSTSRSIAPATSPPSSAGVVGIGAIALVVLQAVRDGIGGCINITCRRGNSDDGANRRVFIDGVSR